MKRRILIITSIKDGNCANHLQTILSEISPGPTLNGQYLAIEIKRIADVANEHQEVLDEIEDYFACNPSGMAVLISDWIVHPHQPSKPTSLALACAAMFRMEAFAVIAVMAKPNRVPDIDRAISPYCPAAELQRALDLVIRRLEYISMPDRSLNFDTQRLAVRALKSNNEMEFRKYFRLRHQVYAIMGYLEAEVEECRSQLEINEADTHAIHIGAFYREQDSSRELLVGTARVVTNRPANLGLRNLFDGIVGMDPVIQARLRTPYGLCMPVFQSHDGMDEIMHDVIQRDLICGELSRVTVMREFRGCGIGRKLINTALEKAVAFNVRLLFLECLDLHEKLYENHGFKRIDGISGPVVDVKRTMIAMQIDCSVIKSAHEVSAFPDCSPPPKTKTKDSTVPQRNLSPS